VSFENLYIFLLPDGTIDFGGLNDKNKPDLVRVQAD
jgi:hypothetical protein